MKKYKRSAAERIFRGNISEYIELSDDGVRLSQDLRHFAFSNELLWHPGNEMESLPGAPDPLEDPNLPFPFTGRELAAFMVDGVGAMLPEVFGDWKRGPDEACLEALGPDAALAREALRDSYEAYRSALSFVGPLDNEVQQRPASLKERFDRENGQANVREGVFEPGVSNREKNVRRARAKESVAHLLDEANTAEKLALAELAHWRRAIVRHLWAASDHDAATLQAILDAAEPCIEPAPQSGEESGDQPIRAHTTISRRARAIRPAIDSAIGECLDPTNTAEVWNVLRRHCLEERDPFTGVISANGHLQYMETNTPKWLRRSNLPRMLR